MSEKKNQAPDNITAVAFNSQYKIDSKVKQKPELPHPPPRPRPRPPPTQDAAAGRPIL